MRRTALLVALCSGLCWAVPLEAATIVFSGVDGTAGTNEIEFNRPPGHTGSGAAADGDLTDLTTDYGAGPLALQFSALDADPARLQFATGMIQDIDEDDPLVTYVGFAGGTSLSISGAAFDGGGLVAAGDLFLGAFPLGMNVLTFELIEPCLYPSICTGTITGPIAAGGVLDAALAAALGVSPVILGGSFVLSADNIVYDDDTGEVEGVVATKSISLEVERLADVPAPAATLLVCLGCGAAVWRRRRPSR